MPLVLADAPRPAVRRLTLNRPAKRNALSWALVDELTDHLRALHYDDETRVVVIAGAGEVFCAGADLDEQFANPASASGRVDIGRADIWPLVETLPQVAIAAVHGAAVTGGFLLAYSADVIVADENATFQDTHAKFGLIPTGGEPQRLAARLGPSRAAELMLTSKRLDAATAKEWGMVSRVSPAGAVVETALAYAEEITAGDADSVRAIKRMLAAGLRSQLGTGLLLDDLTNETGAANQHRSAESERRIGEFLGKSR
jgi:enoyl-CoA hydratase/carnithine racemase